MTIKFTMKDTFINLERKNVERFLVLSELLEIHYYDDSIEQLVGEYEVWAAM